MSWFKKRKYIYDFYLINLSSYIFDDKVKIEKIFVNHGDDLNLVGKNIIYFQGSTCIKKCKWCEGLLVKVISGTPNYHVMFDRVITY